MTNTGEGDVLFRSVIPGGCDEGYHIVSFEGESVSGSAGVLYVVDEYNHVLAEATLNSRTLIELPHAEEYALLVKVFPRSEIAITRASIRPEKTDDAVRRFCEGALRGTVGIVVPTYPTHENKYPCAFVHARVKAYREARVPCDVICAFDYEGYCSYEFEGVWVLRVPLEVLADLLKWHRYKAVLLHFFDLRFARALDSAKLEDVPIFLWSHNPETRYWDWPDFTAPYFSKRPVLTRGQIAEFEERDSVIRRYNELPNVSWVFVSEALKQRSEELVGITFDRSYVIPNLVDEKVFAYRDKSPDLRKRVFLVRKFDNIATYALDIDVACIVELSKRPFFSDMEFDLYGAGDFYDELVKPVRGFDNVHLHRRYLTRDEIATAHRDHGIALYATRFDSQGVSMGEAAMSGLAVVSSDIGAARCFLPTDQGLLCDVEDPVAYADAIERLYMDPAHFAEATRSCHDKMYRLCRREETVDKEIELINDAVGRGFLQFIKNSFSRRRGRLRIGGC